MLLQVRLDQLRHLKKKFEQKTGPLAKPIQFAAVGGTGTVVDLCVFSLLLYLGMVFSAARALAILVAMTWNFYLNRRLTFSYARGGSVLHQYLLFCVFCSLGAIISWCVSVGLAYKLLYFSAHPRQAALAGIACGLASNFILSSKVVFRVRSKHPTAEKILSQQPKERTSQVVRA